jgi:hypothetical protein
MIFILKLPSSFFWRYHKKKEYTKDSDKIYLTIILVDKESNEKFVCFVFFKKNPFFENV